VALLVISACGSVSTAVPTEGATKAPPPTVADTPVPAGAVSEDFSKGFASKDPTTFVVLEFSGGP